MANEEQQVSDHRKMVTLTGNLSDFQLKNLKSWPFIVLGDYTDKVKINYDFTKKEKVEGEEVEQLCAGWVSFDFNFNKKLDLSDEELKLRLNQLSLWTKYLFWKDTEVRFLKQGKKWQI